MYLIITLAIISVQWILQHPTGHRSCHRSISCNWAQSLLLLLLLRYLLLLECRVRIKDKSKFSLILLLRQLLIILRLFIIVISRIIHLPILLASPTGRHHYKYLLICCWLTNVGWSDDDQDKKEEQATCACLSSDWNDYSVESLR